MRIARTKLIVGLSATLSPTIISQSTAEGSKPVFPVSPGRLVSLSLIIWKSHELVVDSA
jgi:hypothetical protein